MLPAPKETIALELLSSGRALYGLEMVRAANGSLRRGTVYVLLDRMEAKGFITSEVDRDTRLPGMPRRRYRITGLGHRALAARDSASNVLSSGPLLEV